MEHQGPSSSSPVDFSIKRKRGRPRKDEAQSFPDKTLMNAGPHSSLDNEQGVSARNTASDSMVGEVVSGVIEGSFDAGYLLKVRVGDSNTHLRGAVFIPGRVSPVTPQNDIAPHAKMCKREDIPLPSLNQQVQPQKSPMSAPGSELNNKPKVSDEIQGSELQSGTIFADKHGSGSVMVPMPSNLPTKHTGSTSGDNVLSHQILALGQEIETLPLVSDSKYDIAPKLEETMQVSEASPESKESKKAAMPFVDFWTVNETGNQEDKSQQRAVSSELNSKEPVQKETEVLEKKHLESPAFVEPFRVDCAMEKQETVLQDLKLELGNKITGKEFENTTHITVPLESNSLNCSNENAHSAPMTSLLVTLFEGEGFQTEGKTSIPSTVIQSVVEPEVGGGSSGTITDDIDPVQSQNPVVSN